MGKWVDQVLRENDSSKFSAKQWQTESLHPSSSNLLSLIGTGITTEHFPQEQADALIAYDAEWRVAGCAAFTALERADEAAEARYGACLSCGGSIELHGSPDASTWRRVASLDDVEIAAVRYVLASAGAIAREARR
jgi:RNA polymerase-binding transcription factor DksA